MKNILHHLRRGRNYTTHERRGVVIGLLLVTLAVTAGGWSLLGKPAVSAESLAVAKIELSADTLPTGNRTGGYVTITLADKETGIPQPDIWVGLRVANPAMQTPGSTYYGWYSPEPGRAFFQTDAQGQVKLPLTSGMPGAVTYQIFAANPELANDAKYQPLNHDFNVMYTGSTSPAI